MLFMTNLVPETLLLLLCSMHYLPVLEVYQYQLCVPPETTHLESVPAGTSFLKDLESCPVKVE